MPKTKVMFFADDNAVCLRDGAYRDQIEVELIGEFEAYSAHLVIPIDGAKDFIAAFSQAMHNIESTPIPEPTP